jgi:ATP-dependent helicase HrpB
MIDLPDLPIRGYLDDIARRLRASKILVLEAEPGAGKTTLVPPGLLDAGFLSEGKLVMLEPRRVAAVQAGRRIAALLGETCGQTCGYRVRGERAVSANTKIEILTEALLIRHVQADPGLSGVSVVILDEFHERSLYADLSLAFLLDSLNLRDDLRVIVMSATMQTEKLASLFRQRGFVSVDFISVPGRCFPVDRVYFPLPGKGRFTAEFTQNLMAILGETSGDVLAFLPGRGEIECVERELCLEKIDAEIFPLYGSLPLAEQSRVIIPAQKPDRRRVILATNIAETSLTVPGVSVVVDSGLERVNRFHLPTGMDRLVTEAISRASAEQRAGRAGRLGPGTAYRLWPRNEHRPEFSTPEILRADISSLALEALLWGVRDFRGLAFLDPPEDGAWRRSLELLFDLGLVDKDGSPHPEAKRVAELGFGPRLGTLLNASPGALAAGIVAILGERDASGLEGEADFRLRLEALRSGNARNQSWLKKTRQEYARILKLLKTEQSFWAESEEQACGDLLAIAFPDRLCRQVEREDRYRFSSGKEARLFAAAKGGSAGLLSGQTWLVAIEVDAGQSGQGLIRLASPVSEGCIERRLAAHAEDRFEIEWDGLRPQPNAGRFWGKLRLGKSTKPVDQQNLPRQIAASFVEVLREKGLDILPWSEGDLQALARSRFFAQHGAPEQFPALDEANLIENAAEWLGPYLFIRQKGNDSGAWHAVVPEENLHQAITALISPWRGAMAKSVPEHISLPSGRLCRVNYADEPAPFIESRIQDFFGLIEQPVAGGQPIVIKLLSPARRPMQITADIAGFWKNSYLEVRKELRGRYPKHPWPQDGTQPLVPGART